MSTHVPSELNGPSCLETCFPVIRTVPALYDEDMFLFDMRKLDSLLLGTFFPKLRLLRVVVDAVDVYFSKSITRNIELQVISHAEF